MVPLQRSTRFGGDLPVAGFSMNLDSRNLDRLTRLHAEVIRTLPLRHEFQLGSHLWISEPIKHDLLGFSQPRLQRAGGQVRVHAMLRIEKHRRAYAYHRGRRKARGLDLWREAHKLRKDRRLSGRESNDLEAPASARRLRFLRFLRLTCWKYRFRWRCFRRCTAS